MVTYRYYSGRLSLFEDQYQAAEDSLESALTNCLAVADSCDAGEDDIVEVGVLLADPADFAAFNEEWSNWFGVDPPARYVAKLGVELPGVLVSIRMVVSVPSEA